MFIRKNSNKKRHRMKHLIILFLLISCGKVPFDKINTDRPYVIKKTNPLFSAYVKQFESDFNVKVKIPIVFEKLNPHYAGTCYIWSDGYRQISINKNHWDSYSEEQREQLIFHELGHCVYNLGHNDLHENNCPVSIMRSFMFSSYESENCYLPNRESYIEDLLNSIQVIK